ncbi:MULTISPECIES: MerR family transcriptional regulator [Streptomyces]|uniref:MerR family transcriptional regulator n=1 Tax=Streptomyces TaxID=1883 RepID=UPI0018F4866E|nr:MerR family transcriptional regulator [Streptomyces sp. N35]
MSYSVGHVAGLAGVTVRTLHHYDEIGLLAPSERSYAGHRRYSDEDLDRLQQILFYRELGFPLDEVKVLLDDPGVDPQEHLRRQHELLADRIEQLQKMATAVEQAMEAKKMGINLTPEERFEVFGEHDPEQYEEEAEQRWGNTDAWAESKRKTSSYTKEDWLRIRAEADDWTRRMIALIESGAEPASEAAMDMAEEHRLQICQYHYTCTHEIHSCLAEMFVADERFTRNIDKAKPGLAAYMSEAMIANALRHL